MRRAAHLSVTILLFATACEAPEPAPAPVVDTAADEAAINAVRDAEVAGFVARDTMGAHLAADAVLMPPGEPAVVGIDAIRTWVSRFWSQVASVAVNYTSTDLTVSGDWAVERYAGTFTITPTAGADPFTETFKGIHVYRREADGSWKMVYDIWNPDSGAPAPPSS